ncbi:hypothetical protein ACIPF8_19050 [Collimonas sp. NPDC087041]|uniref:hypothetical protein n=1 Tax=Collimonas sp. NPDC087041 TaxID=3363960 RepID=UPI00381CE85B
MTQLFSNSHEALVFAFNYSSQQYALSPMSKMMQLGAVGTGKGLVSIDGAAQSGFIRKQVESLSEVHKACIVARYSPRFEECPCCGNKDKAVQEYKEAIATLSQWAVSCFSGLSTRVAREYIIRSYYEKGLSISRVAERTKIGKSTLYDYKSKIIERLKDVDHEAQVAVGDLVGTMIQYEEVA